MTSVVADSPTPPAKRPHRPRVAMVTSALPPQLDGIGDYSARLAALFSSWADVTLHTTTGFTPDPIPGVSIRQSFAIQPRRAVADLLPILDQKPPEAMILQYNPFCFGAKGFNPHLPAVFKTLKQKHPRMHLTVMVHERFMPPNSPRNLVMWAYQFAQFRAITGIADLTLFSTGPWFTAYQRRHPHRKSGHMPVGSNLPFIETDRQALRDRLNLPPEAIVLGSFGGDHPSRLFNYLAAAARRLKQLNYDIRVLSIGSAGGTIRTMLPDLPVIDLGNLPAEEVSKNLQAIDIYCSPFFDGVSTRRGSFFAGLQHGLATVTSWSYNTDEGLLAHADRSFLASESRDEKAFVAHIVELAENPARRHELAAQAKACFDTHYSPNVLASAWRDRLSEPLPLAPPTPVSTS